MNPTAATPDATPKRIEFSPMDTHSPSISVLLVEDDERLARLTARYLESHGVAVTIVGDGDSAVTLQRKGAYDAVLLDLMLPGRDGLAVCRAIRAHSDVPILMVTARGEEADRVVGLEGGADDYLAKPFSSRELLARIRAQVRRARGGSGPAHGDVLQVGSLRLEPDALKVTLDGVVIALTAYEFALLHALA
jgi:two-component system OmpR family response regulator